MFFEQAQPLQNLAKGRRHNIVIFQFLQNPVAWVSASLHAMFVQ